MKERLTKQQAVTEHRKMWDWIAEECLRRKVKVEKQDYFDRHDIKDLPDHFCWCCEYARKQFLKNSTGIEFFCDLCPIVWGSDCDTCIGDWHSTLYEKYVDSTKYGQASILARKIANLPERPTEEWDYVETPE